MAEILQAKQNELNESLIKVKDLADLRGKKLEEAHDLYQFYNDADEASSWLAERKKDVKFFDLLILLFFPLIFISLK